MARPSAVAGSDLGKPGALEPLSPEVLEHTPYLRQRFDNARPFRHVVADGFLRSAYCRELMSEFPAFDLKQALNEFGEVGRKAVFQNLPKLGPAYQRFDRLLRSREFLSWVGEVTGIPHLLYDPDYIGGGTHENLTGQELDPHVDFNYHPHTKLHRRLNLILFLNPEWSDEWGGSLELHLNPWLPPEENRVQKVLPIENRCVIFETSEHSWHGFSRIEVPEHLKLSRRSIAVYFYTKERPAEEMAPDHSTVYVQRPLPSHIKAGYTLQEPDVEAIHNLLDRRDQQIKFLYEREVEYSTTLNRIFRSPTFRIIHLLKWPLRKVRDVLRGS